MNGKLANSLSEAVLMLMRLFPVSVESPEFWKLLYFRFGAPPQPATENNEKASEKRRRLVTPLQTILFIKSLIYTYCF